MYISIVVPYFTPYVRGNEYGLAQSLAKSGHKVTIITSTSKAPREKALSSAELLHKEQNFNVEYLPSLIDVGDNPIITGIKNHIKEQDFVMLQEDYSLICHRAFNASKNYNIPTILSSERTYYPENRMKRYALKVLDATVNKKLRNGADVLTAHCTAAKEFMINELGVRREIAVIHVGVDSEMFRPMKPGGSYFTKEGYKLLTAARLHKYKGLMYLIEAMKMVREDIPDAYLSIIGKGEEERSLRNIINKLKLNDAVRFITQPIPNHEMPALYAECDVYVQPSLIEPYGIAVLEAMACGKPVVGTRVGGMRDTIYKETGFLAEPGDSKEIANYIKLLNNEDTRKRMGMSARKRAVEEFDWSRITAKYMEVLERIR